MASRVKYIGSKRQLVPSILRYVTTPTSTNKSLKRWLLRRCDTAPTVYVQQNIVIVGSNSKRVYIAIISRTDL